MRTPSVVIEHIQTGEKYMFPYQPITDKPASRSNVYVPDQYRLAADQTPVPVIFPTTQTVNWAAEPKDPIKTIEERWKFKNGY
jgi:hypothetical protein